LQANHYEWISDYLAARGMSTAVRQMMALIAASLAICLLVLLRFDGPHETLPIVMTWTAVAGGVAGVALWAWRWPTHGQSVAFALVSNASIALSCLAYPEPQGALTGCISFATIAAYIAFFHSTGLVLYNFVVATAVGVIAAMRIALSGHAAMAVVDLFLVLQINIAMPVAIHVLVRTLGVDLARADRDPLTGLLNRRSFYAQSSKLLAAGPADADHRLVMAVVDLDDFKRINDTYGHQAGDAALVAVAGALGQAVAGHRTVIGRIGGEEFVVAALWETDDPTPLAQRVCDEIARLAEPVTASVGTACASVRRLSSDGDKTSLDRLVRAADAAMYSAKRSGGNRCHHHSEALF
jgi:diguanylate cyclase (GGDEF)-like protein